MSRALFSRNSDLKRLRDEKTSFIDEADISSCGK